MKDPQDWPLILYTKDLEECLDVSTPDAYAILRNATVINPSKRRFRAITKRELLLYLDGGQPA